MLAVYLSAELAPPLFTLCDVIRYFGVLLHSDNSLCCRAMYHNIGTQYLFCNICCGV